MERTTDYDKVVWALREGSPWWPAYVINPTKIRPELQLLGSSHNGIAKKAKLFPHRYRLVFFFGWSNICLLKNSSACIKPMKGEVHRPFVEGFPKKIIKDFDLAESLTISVREAEHFLTQDPSTRLLPVRVPSDLNPSLMQPPTPPSSDDDDDESPTESSESEAEESEYEEPIEPKKSMEKKSSVQRVASKPPEKKPSKQEKTSKTNSNQLTRDGHSKTKSSAPKASEFVAATATKSGGKRKLSKQILVSMDGISDYDTLAWGLPEGYPWWPVYIINPMKIRLQLHHVESDHAALVKKAKLFPDHFRAVFLFGQRTIRIRRSGLFNARSIETGLATYGSIR
ncbi:unnamed protein product [Aphanomyces euteiches]